MGFSVALLLVGCDQSTERAGSIAELTGVDELQGVHVGMHLYELRQLRPQVRAQGYGAYVDSGMVDGYGVSYRFEGWAPNEGAEVPSDSRLELVRLIPENQEGAGQRLVLAISGRLGPPEVCIHRQVGVVWEGEAAIWIEAGVRVWDRVSRPTYGEGRVGPPTRTALVEVGEVSPSEDAEVIDCPWNAT